MMKNLLVKIDEKELELLQRFRKRKIHVLSNRKKYSKVKSFSNEKQNNETFDKTCFLTMGKDSFYYSTKTDREITAFANYYKREVQTERFVLVHSRYPERISNIKITKVTFLN